MPLTVLRKTKRYWIVIVVYYISANTVITRES